MGFEAGGEVVAVAGVLAIVDAEFVSGDLVLGLVVGDEHYDCCFEHDCGDVMGYARWLSVVGICADYNNGLSRRWSHAFDKKVDRS